MGNISKVHSGDRMVDYLSVALTLVLGREGGLRFMGHLLWATLVKHLRMSNPWFLGLPGCLLARPQTSGLVTGLLCDCLTRVMEGRGPTLSSVFLIRNGRGQYKSWQSGFWVGMSRAEAGRLRGLSGPAGQP